MTTLPAASAAATFLLAINSGWFQGVMSAQTPMGWRLRTFRTGPLNGGAVSAWVRANAALLATLVVVRLWVAS